MMHGTDQAAAARAEAQAAPPPALPYVEPPADVAQPGPAPSAYIQPPGQGSNYVQPPVGDAAPPPSEPAPASQYIQPPGQGSNYVEPPVSEPAAPASDPGPQGASYLQGAQYSTPLIG